MTETDNDYFCVLPFFGMEYRQTSKTHCCFLPMFYDIDEIRNDMISGRRSKWCSACWKLEDSGITSDRQLKNAALDFYWDRDIKFIQQDVAEGKYDLRMIKISSSNLCTATCVTCSKDCSTAWGALEKDTTYSKIDKSIIENIEYDKLIQLSLLAGEPLYENLTFIILQNLLDSGNTDCFVSITTNGSIFPKKEQQILLSKFKNLSFNLSIDGIENVFEYMRYPLKWDNLKTNLNLFRTLTDNISVTYTISNLNIFYYTQTINWFKENNLPYLFNPVINPSYFQPSALPAEIKKIICDNDKELNQFIGDHKEQDDINFKEMLRQIKKQDDLKKINIKNYLPEVYDLINS